MSTPLDLYFVRHGQSEGNAAKRLSEAGDSSAFSADFRDRHSSSFRLTDLGYQQARAAGIFLRQNVLGQDFVFDRMYVSEYARAQETAGLLGLPGANWLCDPYLTERDWGDADNLPDDERKKRFGEALKKREVEPFFWRPPNGESFSDLCLRVDRVLDTLHRECSDKRVIIVCHGEVMRAFQVRLERLSQVRFRDLIFSDRSEDRIHNCQITHYTRRDPSSGQIRPYAGWVKWTRPAEEGSPSSDWSTIRRTTYSNADLLHLVRQIPRMVS